MGGLAFSQARAEGAPTLNTPRMSPDDYLRLKSLYITRLQAQFPHCQITSPVEAPEKTDYGDIDVKVCSEEEQIDFIDLANRLGATGVIYLSHGGYQKCTVGVRKDGCGSSGATVVYKPVTTKGAGAAPVPCLTLEEYAQIDIEVMSAKRYAWNAFSSAYGDMAIILGGMLKPLGFTVSDKGLILRMCELDQAKAVSHLNVADADGMLLLSADPPRVMRFLGLSVEQFEAGFRTMEEFYRWLTESRLTMHVEAARGQKRDDGDKLHQRRQYKRSAYAIFFCEWLPAHLGVELSSSDDGSEEGQTDRATKLAAARQAWKEEALDFFHQRAEFSIMHAAFVRNVRNQTACHLLKPLIALHSGKTERALVEIVRSFRRWVGYRDGELYVAPTPHSDQESQLYHLLDEDASSLKEPAAISRWVGAEWETLRGLERQRKEAISLPSSNYS